MAERCITKKEIEQVIRAKTGYIEVPGQKFPRRSRWMTIGKRRINVVFVETANTFQLVTIYDRNEK